MTSNSQPPPRDIPLEYRNDPKRLNYERMQMESLYHLWELVQEIPGLATPYPISDGGTGGSTASDARTNLEVYSTSETYSQDEITTLLENNRRYSLLVS